jgi:hypothetical protein
LEAAVRCRAQLEQLLAQYGEANSMNSTAPFVRVTSGAAAGFSAVGFELGELLPAAMCMCNIGLCVVTGISPTDNTTTPSDVVTEVQQVLQAVMSLCVTALSTAKGKGGDVPMLVLLTECVNLQQIILQHATAAAAAGAAPGLSETAATGLSAIVAPLGLSATVAAGWFVLGRCLQQLSEQLQLCASQPDTYKLSGWFLTSAQVYDCSRTTACQEAVGQGLNELIIALSVLADAVKGWQQEHLMSQISGSSDATLWLAPYRDRLIKASVGLKDDVCPSLRSLTDPEVLAALLDPPPAHQQQLQQREGSARQAFKALHVASSGLKLAGEDLCAVLPNRYFCNNPGCRNAAGVSAGFALVRGAACVCGDCVGSEGAASQEAVAAR